ncbi:unnamed protein product [Cochlearia groenlandica]
MKLSKPSNEVIVKPFSIFFLLLILAKEKSILYVYVPSKAELGRYCGLKCGVIACAITSPRPEEETCVLTSLIQETKEVGVMELLHFMYNHSLSVTATPALLDVLMAADKFEAACCVKFCISLLLKTPMTSDFALLLLSLTCTLLIFDPVKPLAFPARQFIA